jgi:hypothetical protein
MVYTVACRAIIVLDAGGLQSFPALWGSRRSGPGVLPGAHGGVIFPSIKNGNIIMIVCPSMVYSVHQRCTMSVTSLYDLYGSDIQKLFSSAISVKILLLLAGKEWSVAEV